jgi:integrase/recombinase XerD
MTALATTLQTFFTDRLIRQRQASPHTLSAYRDTLRLLLVFASARQKMVPSKLDIDDLDAPLVGAFLDHLEHQREMVCAPVTHGSPRSARYSDTRHFVTLSMPL